MISMSTYMIYALFGGIVDLHDDSHGFKLAYLTLTRPKCHY